MRKMKCPGYGTISVIPAQEESGSGYEARLVRNETSADSDAERIDAAALIAETSQPLEILTIHVICLWRFQEHGDLGESLVVH
jgi:hypothetical protein